MPGEPRILRFDEALALVLEHAARLKRPGVEEVALLECAGRVLARPVLADRDQPPFDRATRDGFALRADEFSASLELRVVGEVRAGETWRGNALGAGEALAIMTGAPLPAGADAVVMVEHVERGGAVSPHRAGYSVRRLAERELKAGDNIVKRGREAAAGAEVVATGTRMQAAEIALAATCGLASVSVFRRPGVAIIATGDELVELKEQPQAHQIRNSNSYALAAMVAEAGGVAGRLPLARDLREEIRERIAQGRMWDLLLLSGGVSMGEYDLAEEVLAEFGAEFLFTGVEMQPGKPLVFGRLPERLNESGGGPECLFFGLPGNPISTQVTFHCFVEPLLRALGGQEVAAPRFVQATLAEAVAGRPGLMRVLPARLTADRIKPEVALVGWQGSGDLAANARANCYAILPPERESFAAGDVVTVLLR